VVYDSILTSRKKQLHNRIGRVIERLYKDNLHQHYGVLADHFINSENFKKGADYSKLAERKAEKNASFNEAISYVKKRIFCLEKLPLDDDVEKKIISARTVLGLYYIQLTLPVKAKEAVDPIVDLSLKRNYKRRVSQINTILGFYYYGFDEDYPKAIEHLEKALKIGKELNDLITLFLAYDLMGCCLSDNCEFVKALSYFEKSLGIVAMANAPWGIVTIKTDIVIWCYFHQGNVKLAYQTSEEALRIADESGDILSKGLANSAVGLSYLLKGYLDEAKEHLLKSAEFCLKCNQLSYAAAAYVFLGNTYLYRGDYKKCQGYYKRAISFWQHTSLFPSYIIGTKISKALAKVMNKEKDINLNEIFKWHKDIRSCNIKEWMTNSIGEILLNIDDQHITEAEDWIKASIETNQKYDMMWQLARGYALYAELFKRKGDLPKANNNLSKAIEIFKDCGADGWVKKYEKELAVI